MALLTVRFVQMNSRLPSLASLGPSFPRKSTHPVSVFIDVNRRDSIVVLSTGHGHIIWGLIGEKVVLYGEEEEVAERQEALFQPREVL